MFRGKPEPNHIRCKQKTCSRLDSVLPFETGRPLRRRSIGKKRSLRIFSIGSGTLTAKNVCSAVHDFMSDSGCWSAVFCSRRGDPFSRPSGSSGPRQVRARHPPPNRKELGAPCQGQFPPALSSFFNVIVCPDLRTFVRPGSRWALRLRCWCSGGAHPGPSRATARPGPWAGQRSHARPSSGPIGPPP